MAAAVTAKISLNGLYLPAPRKQNIYTTQSRPCFSFKPHHRDLSVANPPRLIRVDALHYLNSLNPKYFYSESANFRVLSDEISLFSLRSSRSSLHLLFLFHSCTVHLLIRYVWLYRVRSFDNGEEIFFITINNCPTKVRCWCIRFEIISTLVVVLQSAMTGTEMPLDRIKFNNSSHA